MGEGVETRAARAPRQGCSSRGRRIVRTRIIRRRTARAGHTSAGLRDASSAANARCVAGHWLLVRNVDTGDGSGSAEGVAFAGLPPSTPPDMVGYEFVLVDGVAVRPRGWSCP